MDQGQVARVGKHFMTAELRRRGGIVKEFQ